MPVMNKKKENLETFIDFARTLHVIVSREQPHTTTYQPLNKLIESCDQSGKFSDWLRRAPETAKYFPLLADIACRIICAPLGTATVERSFSTMNRIATRLRQRLLPEHLRDAMLVSSEGSSFNDFATIVYLWHSKKPRRLPIPAANKL